MRKKKPFPFEAPEFEIAAQEVMRGFVIPVTGPNLFRRIAVALEEMWCRGKKVGLEVGWQTAYDHQPGGRGGNETRLAIMAEIEERIVGWTPRED